MTEPGTIVLRSAPPVALRNILDATFRGRADFESSIVDARGHVSDETRAAGAAGNRAVARLVLDGVLELDGGDGFVSGPRAHGTVFVSARRRAADGRLADLSGRALRYAQELAITDVRVLARRLYLYGAIPRGPRWEALVGGAGELMHLLGLGPEGRVRRVLAHDYMALTHPSWLSWSRVSAGDETLPELPYKIYVSLRPEAMSEGFPRAAAVLADQGVWSFKVARGVLGLLRPDKLVVYLADVDELARVAAALADAVDGCPAQGVPFTAAAAADGLISWGMDPPSGEGQRGPRSRDSWRSWITECLARALVGAQPCADAVEPWEFALDRLAVEGVDTVTWQPTLAIWNGAGQA